MKTCLECGGSFKNLGAHMRKHSASKNLREEQNVQEAQEADAEETKPQRPIERFKTNRFVFGNGAGVMLRR